jgi:hypothetical protein
VLAVKAFLWLRKKKKDSWSSLDFRFYRFASVANGMTEEQVLALLGEPDSKAFHPVEYTYTFRPARVTCTVCFDPDGHVIDHATNNRANSRMMGTGPSVPKP